MKKPRRKPREQAPTGWLSELGSETPAKLEQAPGFEEHGAIRNEPLQRPAQDAEGAPDRNEFARAAVTPDD